jgi:hypothetical protein
VTGRCAEFGAHAIRQRVTADYQDQRTWIHVQDISTIAHSRTSSEQSICSDTPRALRREPFGWRPNGG